MSAIPRPAPSDAAAVLDDLKRKLIDAGRILEENGQADLTRGHVSVRMPGEPGLFLMKPHSLGFGEMDLANIVVCDLDGTKVGGGGRRHSEVFIHSEIYKARPDVQSVIHAHPVHAVALSATGKPLLPISQPAVTFYDGVPYYTDTIELIRTPELGAGVARALGAHQAVLMRNHGVAVVGTTLEEATMLAITLDNACQIQLLAMAAGGVGEMFPHDNIERLHRVMQGAEAHAISFEYLRRKLRPAS